MLTDGVRPGAGDPLAAPGVRPDSARCDRDAPGAAAAVADVWRW